MTLNEAIEILRQHQAWRRGGEGEMQNPKQIGYAIDRVLSALETNQINVQLNSVN